MRRMVFSYLDDIPSVRLRLARFRGSCFVSDQDIWYMDNRHLINTSKHNGIYPLFFTHLFNRYSLDFCYAIKYTQLIRGLTFQPGAHLFLIKNRSTRAMWKYYNQYFGQVMFLDNLHEMRMKLTYLNILYIKPTYNSLPAWLILSWSHYK